MAPHTYKTDKDGYALVLGDHDPFAGREREATSVAKLTPLDDPLWKRIHERHRAPMETYDYSGHDWRVFDSLMDSTTLLPTSFVPGGGGFDRPWYYTTLPEDVFAPPAVAGRWEAFTESRRYLKLYEELLPPTYSSDLEDVLAQARECIDDAFFVPFGGKCIDEAYHVDKPLTIARLRKAIAALGAEQPLTVDLETRVFGIDMGVAEARRIAYWAAEESEAVMFSEPTEREQTKPQKHYGPTFKKFDKRGIKNGKR